jgi:hypothetical protein
VLPNTCTRLEATWKKAVKVSILDHKAIMEEATKCDRWSTRRMMRTRAMKIVRRARSVSQRASSK